MYMYRFVFFYFIFFIWLFSFGRESWEFFSKNMIEIKCTHTKKIWIGKRLVMEKENFIYFPSFILS